jgi:hypothetical protein
MKDQISQPDTRTTIKILINTGTCLSRCSELRMASLDPFGLQALGFFKSSGTGVWNADERRADFTLEMCDRGL